MTRVAAVDCGTNSIRLLIADLDEYGGLHDIVRTREIVRLGEGVDRTGRFADAALDRTLTVIRNYAELCREHKVERIRFVATSATRDAANRADFTDAVQEILGVPAEVISGTEEASLSFKGALMALAATESVGNSAAELQDEPQPQSAKQHLIIDLGGGSTELVLGADASEASYSMDIGCVRLSERHIHNDPPLGSELNAIRSDVQSALGTATQRVDVSLATEVIGVAGTITTITAHALNLTSYDSNAISGSRLPLADILAACDSLSKMSKAELTALPYMHPARVDVMAAGSVIWATVLQRIAEATALNGQALGFVTTSEHDILDGAALSLG